jgi:uridine kinase
LEEVRAKLAALSQAGKTAAVKQLIASYGSEKLTAIPADKYADVLEKAAAL